MKVQRRSLVFYGVLCFFAMQLWGERERIAQHFSIDRLYPESWYTRACEYCMRVWGMFNEMGSHKAETPKRDTAWHNTVIDVSIGQLVSAKNCVSTLLEKQCVLAYDDIIYLSRIIGTLEERYAHLPAVVSADKRESLQRTLQALRKKVEQLLQANYPRSRSRH